VVCLIALARVGGGISIHDETQQVGTQEFIACIFPMLRKNNPENRLFQSVTVAMI
jgi:hypothetical protein